MLLTAIVRLFSGDVASKHLSVKLFTRFALIVGLAVCGILYFGWELSLSELPRRVDNRWKQPAKRLIVFGDSWSDNGQYLIDPPRGALLPFREEAQGLVWTEWLCLSIGCSHHDNFARSLPASRDSEYMSPVIDSSLLDNISTFEYEAVYPLADLKTQVAQWIRFERERSSIGRGHDFKRDGAIFVVWFSLWDLWYFSKKTKDEASEAVDRTMDTLFEQLDVIAEHSSSRVRVIMPDAIDPTFLPGWRATRTGLFGSDRRADDQRNAVRLVKKWNKALDDRAATWKKGVLYISGAHKWLLDQLREQQLIARKLSDRNGLGTHGSPWIDVQSGCIVTTNDRSPDLGEAPRVVDRCPEPNKYLFWDDMHLGPEAMKIIGQGIANAFVESGGSFWSNRNGSSQPKR